MTLTTRLTTLITLTKLSEFTAEEITSGRLTPGLGDVTNKEFSKVESERITEKSFRLRVGSVMG